MSTPIWWCIMVMHVCPVWRMSPYFMHSRMRGWISTPVLIQSVSGLEVRPIRSTWATICHLLIVSMRWSVHFESTAPQLWRAKWSGVRIYPAALSSILTTSKWGIITLTSITSTLKASCCLLLVTAWMWRTTTVTGTCTPFSSTRRSCKQQSSATVSSTQWYL